MVPLQSVYRWAVKYRRVMLVAPKKFAAKGAVSDSTLRALSCQNRVLSYASSARAQ